LTSVYMWYFSIVFKCAPFFWLSRTCIISSMGPNECTDLIRYLAML
jgi:hypothetical protein